MAGQKIQDKQKAILEAAVAVFAARGFWNTPTALISKTAGVADGTLFTYFATKDELISSVYLEIKREIAEALLEGLSAHETVQDKLRHIWSQYILWGVQHPEEFNVLRQISESFELAPEVKAQGNEPFVEVQEMANASIQAGEFLDYPVDYLAALMDSQAAMTIRFIMLNRGKQIDYQKIGFDILWKGVTR